MDANKTYTLRLKPIAEITEEEIEENVLATNGVYWISGIVRWINGQYECYDNELGCILNVTHFAVLPKDE